MIPTVDFCGLKMTRLIIGANPFGGFSHQNAQRDREMRDYYTPEKIIETWERAENAGINAMVTNNESPHVVQAVGDYLAAGGSLQWVAQVNSRGDSGGAAVLRAADAVIELGCKALYFHGGLVDNVFSRRDAESLTRWCDHVRSSGTPVGVAGHDPRAHRWVNDLDIVDFHAVCFFNCGSLHDGRGERFRLSDLPGAVDAIHSIEKPCIAYKIMGAGRIDPRMAFEYAFGSIKPGDVVNVGIHRGDRDNMVEENASYAAEILENSAAD